MLKAVVFDVDGTLLDTREFIAQAFEATLARFGFPAPSREMLSSIIGPPLQECYAFVLHRGHRG